jgi:hypothetical protein
VFSYAFSDFFLTGVGTGVSVGLDVNDVWKFACIFGYGFHVNCSGYVESAVADEYADARLLGFWG